MRSLKRQHGYSLIEVLVAMTLAVIVFGATLTMLEVYMRQSNATNQRNDAQDRARVGIDRIVRQLRNVASPLAVPKLLERATPYDIVFQTIGAPQGGNVSGVERVRYCVPGPTDTPANNTVLISQTQTWSSLGPKADPWTSDPTQTIPCPDPNFVPTAGQPQYAVVATGITNRSQSPVHPAFLFNDQATAPTDLTQISTIQLDLFVNPTPQLQGARTELQSSAFLRNKQHAPQAYFSPSPPSGTGGVVLNGGSSFSPDGEQLSYSWSCTSCSGSTSLDKATDGLVTWNPGPGTYTVQLIVTDETGIQSEPYTLTVTVT